MRPRRVHIVCRANRYWHDEYIRHRRKEYFVPIVVKTLGEVMTCAFPHFVSWHEVRRRFHFVERLDAQSRGET